MDLFYKTMITIDTSIETLPYRISSSQYFGVIATRMLRQWWSVILLLFVALVAASCVELRCGILLLMFIFIIAPFIIFMIYYNYALRPEAFYSVVDKNVILHSQGIDCMYDEKRRSVVSWSQVQRVERTSTAFHIYTHGYTYFFLPRDAFASREEMIYFEQEFLPRILS